jgi:hypothetical protein
LKYKGELRLTTTPYQQKYQHGFPRLTSPKKKTTCVRRREDPEWRTFYAGYESFDNAVAIAGIELALPLKTQRPLDRVRYLQACRDISTTAPVLRSGATMDTRFAAFELLTDGILEFAELVSRGETF